MIFLKVPYAEKDEAKALGARWNKERKAWYVPDGQAAAQFERWLVSPQPGQDSNSHAALATDPKSKLDTYSSKPVVGKHYVELQHNCNPFVECAECLPILERSGWKAAQNVARELLDSVGAR